MQILIEHLIIDIYFHGYGNELLIPLEGAKFTMNSLSENQFFETGHHLSIL